MSDKWTRVQGAIDRAHSDLFSPSEYQATYYNYPDPSAGDYDPNTGEISEGSRNQVAQFQVEYGAPTIDTSIQNEGTSFDWDAEIRFPQDKLSQGDIIPLGEDNKRPSEVDLSDPNTSDSTTYEVHGYAIEQGSSMYKLRLIEQ